MHATDSVTYATTSASGTGDRYVVRTASAVCEIRARAIVPIAEVLGFESEMDFAAEGVIDPAVIPGGIDGALVVDLLDSRMIAPPRLRRRRQRAVSSRAIFYGTGRK